MNSNVGLNSRRGQSSSRSSAAQSWRSVISLIIAAAIFCTGILFERVLNPCIFDGIILQTKTAKDKNDGYLRSNSLSQQSAADELSSSGAQVQKMRQWENWPAIAYKEVQHALVTKGDSFFNQARELYYQKNHHPSDNNDDKQQQTLMDEFLKVYKNRPDQTNLCGIRINHALALFLAVKQINPTLVVESGVNAGVSTYIIRTASPTTKIFAIDPLDKPICGQGKRWVDPSDLTINYSGENFIDLLDLDWKGMIAKKEVDPGSTLVFLDDHLHTFDRIAGVRKFGIRHVVVEDNYKLGEGATPHDKKSTPKQMLHGEQWKKQGEWLFNNIVAYSEFPPLVPPIMAAAFKGERKEAGGFMVAADDNMDIVHPMLRPDLNEDDMKTYTNIADTLGYDKALVDNESYMQFMNYNQICHLELKSDEETTIDN
uniref:Uncharacterized protein n=1 Tax=Odontella aurita TaxID=265563 RepID=A0A7S4N2Y8_9STRA|mmetsp:Transcript_45988/g.139620  ORF Transcript_45988/g.139620 Transcript_45988/m.139620 type:complete len:428 (+) Transcript_45988:155-1438(+)|eukprot:CAMPEP_0113547648 /NCGR_PEP_ID=MMETSP0015_2-20120614/12470_1 /TAXON_ID=2838 /ORGANISM="Odontella" /LENGTH=427 /DNA_ID=CAMNT_0000448221 /DNA_START=86 /DNA_END=1366 /DNA_ORIENTATION=+ /assembly_acc=CAM_ASM_000160